MDERSKVPRTYRLHEDVVQRLEIVCAILRVSKEAYVEQALEEKLAREEPQALARLNRPSGRKGSKPLRRQRYSPARRSLREAFPKVAESQDPEASEDR